MRAPILALLGFVWGLGSCQSQPTAQDPIEQQHEEAWLDGKTLSQAFELPAGWLEGNAHHFTERWAEWNLPKELLWSHSAQERLSKVLLQPDADAHAAQLSVRAALLLALDPSPPSQTALMIRLERRLPPQARGRQAVEIVCANALARMKLVQDETLANLSKLAIGRVPHPDLDVRVECGRAYLAHIPMAPEGATPLKARENLRFLIKVLRAETPAQANDPPTWPRKETVAWPKGRAAEELMRWHPSEVPFLPDGPWQAQMDWAQEAQLALGL